MRSASTLWALLFVAAGARLMLQVAALPPYSGLDEVYHVARAGFVAQENRQPLIHEPSIAPYLYESMHAVPGAPPAFGELHPRWPELVRRGPIAVDRAITPANEKPYVRPNYEAQQPASYYAIVARFVSRSTQLGELRSARLLALLLALVIIASTAWLAVMWNGSAGFIAAALLVSVPTWLTLVVRSSNDALACAFVAVGIAISASARGFRLSGAPAPSPAFFVASGKIAAEGGGASLRTVETSALKRASLILVEALAWAGAIAAKLYTWPVAIVLPLFWWKQRASPLRIILVSVACLIAAGVTLDDLSTRTRNPIGNFGFDPIATTGQPQPIDVVEMVKITIASFIWTSGQHANALRPLGMALYFGPLSACVAFVVIRRREEIVSLRSTYFVFIVATLTFAVAHLFNASGFIRQARAAGLSLPLGGKEGWYWYALAPLALATIGALVIRDLGRARWLLLGWILLWDIIIHEAALFHDFAGATSPAVSSALFTWGPLHPPFTASLEGIGVGPGSGWTLAFRAIHIGALGALLVLESKLQGSSSDGRHSDAA